MEMPSMQLVDSVGTAAAIIGVLAIFAFMALADKENMRKPACAAVAVSAAATLLFVGCMWYCTPVDASTELRLVQCYELAPPDALGRCDGADGESAYGARMHSVCGEGEYMVVVRTEDGGFTRMVLPEDRTTIYLVDDLAECRLEKWMDSEVKTYRDGTSEAKFLSGIGRESWYKLHVLEGSAACDTASTE